MTKKDDSFDRWLASQDDADTTVFDIKYGHDGQEQCARMAWDAAKAQRVAYDDYFKHEFKQLERAVRELGIELDFRDDGSFARAYVPGGFQIAPQEPTAEMKTAGMETSPVYPILGTGRAVSVSDEDAGVIYKAMLAVAPKL